MLAMAALLALRHHRRYSNQGTKPSERCLKPPPFRRQRRSDDGNAQAPRNESRFVPADRPLPVAFCGTGGLAQCRNPRWRRWSYRLRLADGAESTFSRRNWKRCPLYRITPIQRMRNQACGACMMSVGAVLLHHGGRSPMSFVILVAVSVFQG